MSLKKYLRAGNGAADITPLLGNKLAFKQVVESISNLFKDRKVDFVACIEGRGFLLGGAVAYNMGCGIVPIRYPGKLKNRIYSQTFIDYSGKQKELQIHQDALQRNQNVIVVDDWVETGATVTAAIKLIEKCGGNVVGIGIFMDDSSKRIKNSWSKYNYRFLEQTSPEDKF